MTTRRGEVFRNIRVDPDLWGEILGAVQRRNITLRAFYEEAFREKLEKWKAEEMMSVPSEATP